MANRMKCECGHQWESSIESGGSSTTICPACGASAVPTPDQATRQGFAPEPIQATALINLASTEMTLVGPPSAASFGIRQIPGYAIFGELGRGGMGVVYKARQVGLNRLVALKMVLADAHARPEDLLRFRGEAEAVARLQHPGIVQIYEIGEHDGRPYIALEFLDGGSLAHKLAGSPLAAIEAASIGERLARAVQYAHDNGIIHRDLKPGNVLLQTEPNARVKDDSRTKGSGPTSSSRLGSSTTQQLALRAKITDFGLAKQLDTDSSQTRTGAILGTPSYMAPEQAAGHSRDIGPSVDIYSLGAILYEMLVGRPPFRAATVLETLEQVRSQEPVPPSRLQPGLPRDLETICLKCLQKEPAKRYESAGKLADDLARFLDGAPIAARPVSTTEHVWRWARRKPVVAGLSAAVMVLLLAIVVLPSVLAFRLDVARQDAEWESKRASLSARQATEEAANAQEQQKLAEVAQARAEAEEKTARRRLYAAQMNLAQQAREQGKMARVLELLETQRPRFDEEDLRSFEWYHLWDVCFGRQRQRSDPLGSSTSAREAVYSIAVAPDGTTLVAGTRYGQLYWWKLPEFEAETTVATDQSAIWSVRFSPDGQTLATSGESGITKLWDVRSKTELKSFRFPDPARAVAFTTDGTSLVVGYWATSNNVRLLDITTGESKATLSTGQVIEHIAVSPNGEWLATGHGAGAVQIWSMSANSPVEHRSLLSDDWVAAACVAFSPDSRRLATGTDSARVFDVATGNELASLPREAGRIFAVSFSPDGKKVCFTGQDRQLKLWDLNSNQIEVLPSRGPLMALAFAPDGQSLFVTGEEAIVREWQLDAEPNPQVLAIKGVSNLAFAPSTPLLAVASRDGSARLVDAASNREMASLPAHNSAEAIAFSPDGSKLATAGRDSATCSVKLWDVENRRLDQTFLEPTDRAIQAIDFSSDGTKLAASFTGPGPLRVWDTGSNAAIGPPDTLPWVRTIVYSPTGRYFATGEQFGTVRLWDAEQNKRVGTIQGNTGSHHLIMSVAFTRDGRRLAAGSNDGTIKLWDVASQRLLATFTGHAAEVQSVAFFPDAETLASSSRDGMVRLWDTSTFQERGAMRAHDGPAWTLAISHDGALMATADPGGKVHIWKTSRHADALARRNELDPDDPTSPVALKLQAMSLITGQPRAAEEMLHRAHDRLEKLVAAFPEHETYRYELVDCRGVLAVALDKQQRFNEALAILHADRPVLEQFSANGRFGRDAQTALESNWSNAVLLLWKLKRTDEALLEASAALAYLKRKSGNLNETRRIAPALAKIARLYLLMDERQLAARIYEELIAIGSTDANWWNSLAWQFVADPDPKAHDPVRAVELARKAVELAPRSGAIWNTLATAQYRAGDWQAATESIEKVMETGQVDPIDMLIMAMALYQQDDAAGARLWFHRAERTSSSLSPTEELERFRAEARSVLGLAEGNAPDPPATQAAQWLEAARTLVKGGAFLKAIPRFDGALELAPDDTAARLERAEACERLALWSRVVDDYSQLLKSRTNDVALLRKRAEAYRALKAWNEALADFARLVQLDPDDWQTRLARSELHDELGQHAQALADLEALAAMKPDEPAIRTAKAKAVVRQAEASLRANEPEKAIKLCDEAIAQAPDLAAAWFQRGSGHFARKEWESAARDLDKAVELGERGSYYLCSRRATAHRNVGESHWRRGNHAEALARFNRAYEICTKTVTDFPDEPWACNEMGWIREWRGKLHSEQGRKEEAEADFAAARTARQTWLERGRNQSAVRNTFITHIWRHLATPDATLWGEAARRAVELWPAEADCWAALAIVEHHLGRSSEAAAAIAESLALRPTADGWIWFHAGLIQHHANEERANQAYEQGVDWLIRNEQWLERHKEEAEKIRSLRAKAAALLRKPIEPLADLNRAVAMEPKDAERWLRRARHFQTQNQFDKAIDDLNKAIELQPRDPVLWAERANIHGFKQRRWDLAEKDYTAATELNPREADYWSHRATSFNHRGQYAKAIGDATKAIELRPTQSTYWGQRGHAKFHLGQYDEAKSDLLKAVELKSTSALYWKCLAEVQLHSGEVPAYKKTVAGALAQLSDNKEPYQSCHLASIGLWTADSGADPSRAIERAAFAAQSIPKTPWFLSTLALAHHRAGDHDSAIAAARECLKVDSKWPQAWLILALAHHVKGQSAEARDQFKKADDWLTTEKDRLAKSPNAARSYHWLEILFLHKEGKELINP